MRGNSSFFPGRAPASGVGDAGRRFLPLRLRLARLIVVLFAGVTVLRGAPTNAQLIDYVRNSWDLAEASDDTIVELLDTSYSGIPYKKYVSYFLVAPQILNPLIAGDYKAAAQKAAGFGADQTISLLLAEAGLEGVAA